MHLRQLPGWREAVTAEYGCILDVRFLVAQKEQCRKLALSREHSRLGAAVAHTLMVEIHLRLPCRPCDHCLPVRGLGVALQPAYLHGSEQTNSFAWDAGKALSSAIGKFQGPPTPTSCVTLARLRLQSEFTCSIS